jgi:hypothetical protein
MGSLSLQVFDLEGSVPHQSIASVKAIKYIYKYVYKGHDKITMEFGTCGDEIKLC